MIEKMKGLKPHRGFSPDIYFLFQGCNPIVPQGVHPLHSSRENNKHKKPSKPKGWRVN